MSRSIKKGPFAAPELLKRVDEMNKAGTKQVIKTFFHYLPVLRRTHHRCS